jgi:tetratricopeptide (TPR) repeat protein
MERSNVQTLIREAIASARSGNKSWARDCLSRILRIDPRNEEAWLWLSSVLETPSEKRFCLEKVLAVNPDNAQAQAGLRYLVQQSQAPAAIARLPRRTICPMCGEPNDPSAFQCANCGQNLFVMCPACGERVDIDRISCALCGQEVGLSSDGPAYFFHLGELYLQHGQPKSALDAWDKTLFLNPDYPRVAEVAAEAFLASGQRDLAFQSLQRAIEETPDATHRRELRLRLANYNREVGNIEEAERLYQELLKEDQENREPHADLYTELGRLYQKKKDREAARHYYEMAVALDENLYDAHYALAEILLQAGYELRALNEFRRLESVGGEVAEQAKAQIQALRPPVPEDFRNRWQETLRGTARFFLAGVLLLLLTVAGRWAASPWKAAGLIPILIGGYFITAATATPRNLPSLAGLARLADSPTMVRMQARRKKKDGRPSLLRRFLTWQARSAQRVVAGLRVTQMQAVQLLHRLATRWAQTWDRFKLSRVGRAIRAFPQTRFGRFLAAVGRTPFFQATGRFLRRIFPGFRWLGTVVQGGSKRLIERAGHAEITEAQISRWLAAAAGLLLLGLGAFLVLW